MSDIPSEELFEFPCDHMFKAFGPNDEDFYVAVRTAVSSIIPVPLDAMKTRTSSKGAHQAVTVLVRVLNYSQLLSIYTALKGVPGLRYLL